MPRGATQDLILTPQAPAEDQPHALSTTRRPALQALISGQIDVVGTGLLVTRTLNRNDPGKNYEVKIVLRPLHFGIGIRRGPDRAAAVAEHLRLHHQEQRRARRDQPQVAASCRWSSSRSSDRRDRRVDYVFQFGVVWRDFDPPCCSARGSPSGSRSLAMGLGLIVGVATALAAASRLRALRALARVYVEAIRNTPFLMQLLFVYLGLPSIGLRLRPDQAALLAHGDQPRRLCDRDRARRHRGDAGRPARGRHGAGPLVVADLPSTS